MFSQAINNFLAERRVWPFVLSFFLKDVVGIHRLNSFLDLPFIKAILRPVSMIRTFVPPRFSLSPGH